MSQTTCITLAKYSGAYNKLWAFGMMQFAHQHLAQAPGLQFYKLMGSGKGMGFNPLPDWSTYALLTVWDNEDAANDFILSSALYDKYRSHTAELATLFLDNLASHGAWSGKQPFEEAKPVQIDDRQILILTRATIKKRHLVRFWRYVPTSSLPLQDNQELLYTKGVGEVPVIQMATISIWRSLEGVKRFAYQSAEHRTAIKMTRQYDWYREELFARFSIRRMDGVWNDLNVN